jgi:MFS family permease
MSITVASEKTSSHGPADEENGTVDSHPALPYSVFLPSEKWLITTLVAYAAMFSTISSFIYYPAIPSIAISLSVSIDRVNWTVTSYMAIATIAPTLVGDAADTLGRRPAYLFILSLYIASNVAIAAIHSYSSLLGLRIMQALAISGQSGIRLLVSRRPAHMAVQEVSRLHMALLQISRLRLGEVPTSAWYHLRRHLRFVHNNPGSA